MEEVIQKIESKVKTKQKKIRYFVDRKSRFNADNATKSYFCANADQMRCLKKKNSKTNLKK